MVHKKSEYRLQYHKLSNELRHKIWKENIDFRNLQRQNNLANHYWEYQLLDDDCICDKESENDSEEEMGILHRERNKACVDNYGGRHFTSSREIAIQTPDWGISNGCIDATSQCETQNVSTGTVTLPDDNVSSVREMTPKDLKERPSNPVPPCIESDTLAIPVQSHREQIHGQSENVKALLQKQSEPTAPLKSKIKQHHEDKPCGIKSRFDPSPTRTALKSFYERPKAHFAAYGWNDQDKDIGDKKTHSVFAPKDQVYSTALHAMDLRNHEMEQYLAMERKRKREQHRSIPVNLSSIWMTEYQDKFSKGLRESLHTYSQKNYTACRKPVVLRYI